MANVLERLPEGASVTVIRLRSLGDCVLTTPALHLLKQFRPDLRVSVVVEPRFAPVFEGNSDLDAVLRPEAFAVAHARPRLCLNFHGGTRSMLLTLASVATFRAGFTHHRGAALYNIPIPKAQEILNVNRTVHTAEHLASAMFWLGVPVQAVPRARLFAPAVPAQTPYAVLHPLAALPEKTWPAERFVAVARVLEREHGLEPVFIAGQGEDLTPFGEFRCVSGAPLRDVISLLSAAALFVGNDSGPAHLAAAFGVPVVVLFGASDPTVWAPWRTASESIIAADGLNNVPVNEVLHALERLRVGA